MKLIEALGVFISILRSSSPLLRDGYELHVSKNEYEKAREVYNRELVYPSLPWRPIAELADRYENELLLMAPELVDLDCNVHGVGMGYWQDGPVDVGGVEFENGTWLACKWSMTNDEWYEVPCTPTHFLKLSGA